LIVKVKHNIMISEFSMRSRKSRQAEEDDEDSTEDVSEEEESKSSKKFKPELGSKLAYTSLLALGLCSLSGTWFYLLQSQPMFVYLGLTVVHLALAFSLGKSFLPCHFSVWVHASFLGVTLSSGN
jgi:hypothetical protein